MVWKLKPVSEYHRCPSLSSPGLKDHSCNLSWLIGISRPPRLKHHSGKKWKRERGLVPLDPVIQESAVKPSRLYQKCVSSESGSFCVRRDYSGLVLYKRLDKNRFKHGTSRELVLKKCSVKSSWRLSLDWCQDGCWLELLEEMPQEKKTLGKKDLCASFFIYIVINFKMVGLNCCLKKCELNLVE